MSVWTTIALRCDAPGCEVMFPPVTNPQHSGPLREAAETEGWAHGPGSREDYCPVHGPRRGVTQWGTCQHCSGSITWDAARGEYVDDVGLLRCTDADDNFGPHKPIGDTT